MMASGEYSAPDLVIPIARAMGLSLSELCGRVIHGDCATALTAIPNATVKLIHTSPPYNIGKAYKSADDAKALGEYLSFIEAVVGECYRTMAPNASMFFQVGYSEEDGGDREILPIDVLTHDIFRRTGFRLWDRIVWHYFGGMSFTRKFKNTHETILWWVKPGNGKPTPFFNVDEVRERSRSYDKRNNLFGKNPGNVWTEDRVAFGGASRATSHIAVFPESISERIIRACTQIGDLVIDPFAGSGTTLAVARSLGRNWIGIEISEEYALEAAYRIAGKQPSEWETLASSVIKVHGFGNKRGGRSLSVISSSVETWLGNVGLVRLKAIMKDKMSLVTDQDLFGPAERKEAKPQVWAFFDSVLNGTGREYESLRAASGMLDVVYKQRSRWNSLRKCIHTIQTVQQLAAEVSAVGVDAIIGKVLAAEPSSYRIDGSQVYFTGNSLILRGAAESSDARKKPSPQESFL